MFFSYSGDLLCTDFKESLGYPTISINNWNELNES